MMPKLPLRRAAVLPVPALGGPAPLRVPSPGRFTLRNGLRVIVVPWSTLPQVGIRLLFPAGSVGDPDGLQGTASFVGSMLTEGTHLRSAEELNAQLDRLGASLGVQVGHDFTEVDLFLLSETLPEAIRLLAEVVRSPSFPAAETERIRAETLDSLEARDDEPANVADDALAAALYGPDHPYGVLSDGTVEGVEAVTRDALVDFHSRHYRPSGAVLLVAGHFDEATLRAVLEECFGDWTGSAAVPSYPAAPTPLPSETLAIGWPEAAQGEIRFGGLGMPRTSADWVPAALANYLLGGSTITGRLGANLREDKGWTYGIRSGFSAAVQSGGWVIETAVDAAVIEGAVTEILQELHRLVSEPVDDDELRRAKDALILSLPRAFETPGRIIGRFGALEAFGLPLDYWDRFPSAVESVTPDDIRRVAHTYFHPDVLTRVIVGPQ
ncbi:MAG: insulinase family protein [Gemmatimonadetes bacterium]|nr:insulinase family protein [Gemmatimonadota bacterium]